MKLFKTKVFISILMISCVLSFESTVTNTKKRFAFESKSELSSSLNDFLKTVNDLNDERRDVSQETFFKKAKDSLVRVFNRVLSQAIYTLHSVKEDFEEIVEDLQTGLERNWQNFKDSFLIRLDEISEFVKKLTDYLKEFIPDLLSLLRQTLKKTVDITGNTVDSDVLQHLLDTFDLNESWYVILKADYSIVEQFKALLNQIFLYDQSVWNQAKSIFSELKEFSAEDSAEIDKFVLKIIKKLNKLLVNQ